MNDEANQAATRIFEREDKNAEFWREYFIADREGRVTREMIHRGEQLLRQQDKAVRRFLDALKK